MIIVFEFLKAFTGHADIEIHTLCFVLFSVCTIYVFNLHISSLFQIKHQRFFFCFHQLQRFSDNLFQDLDYSTLICCFNQEVLDLLMNLISMFVETITYTTDNKSRPQLPRAQRPFDLLRVWAAGTREMAIVRKSLSKSVSSFSYCRGKIIQGADGYCQKSTFQFHGFE